MSRKPRPDRGTDDGRRDGRRGWLPSPGLASIPLAMLLLALGAADSRAGEALVGASPGARSEAPAAPATAPSQEGPGRLAPEPLPDRPTAYLVTVGPGDAVWERFGHNLIWIHDPAARTGEGYNYGLFSFEQENFILRFIRGQMRYWMAGIPVERQLEAYRSQRRSIRIQELALTTDQVRELHGFLEWNERPENRFYRYEYYRDNCSTRVRDALDRVLDGRLAAWARERPTDGTYRDHTLRQTHGLFWVGVGMHFGLGPSVDDPLSAWQAMFIPMKMEEHLRDFTVETRGGARVPFVRSEWTWYDSARPPTPETTPRWTGLFAGLGLVLAALVLGAGRAARTGSGRAPAQVGGSGSRLRVGFALPAGAWLGLVGLLGLLIGLLWAFTDHVDTHGNLNLWHATPLHLALAPTLWPLARGRRWAVGAARWLAAALAALSLVGLAVEALPGVAQVNAEFLVLLVPTNLALAWTVWRAAAVAPARSAGA